MSATNAFETDLLELIFNGTTISNIADDAASSPATDLYISLHTADPGETGSQTTSEATYTSYARVAVARSGAAWIVSGNSVTNAAAVVFPKCTAGSNTITHFGIGLDASGTGTLLFSGELDDAGAVSLNITPRYEIGDLEVTVD